MDARNMGEYLRLGRKGRTHTESDLKGKPFTCMAVSNTAGLNLPSIAKGRKVTVMECDFKGELIPDGMSLSGRVGANGCVYLGINALGKRFKIIKISRRIKDVSTSQPQAILKEVERDRKEVLKNGGREKPGSGREGLQEAPGVVESDNPK